MKPYAAAIRVKDRLRQQMIKIDTDTRQKNQYDPSLFSLEKKQTYRYRYQKMNAIVQQKPKH